MDAVNDLVGGELYKFINESGIYTLGEPLNSEKQPEIEWVDGNDFTFIFDLATPEKVSFEVSKDDTIPHYSINVTQEAKAEMKKNLSDEQFTAATGSDKVNKFGMTIKPHSYIAFKY